MRDIAEALDFSPIATRRNLRRWCGRKGMQNDFFIALRPRDFTLIETPPWLVKVMNFYTGAKKISWDEARGSWVEKINVRDVDLNNSRPILTTCLAFYDAIIISLKYREDVRSMRKDMYSVEIEIMFQICIHVLKSIV